MKKFICSILILVFVFPTILAGCAKDKDSFTDSDKLKIVASIFPYYDFAKNIAGDKAEIKLLLSPGSEPHDYEPTPSDIVAIENCDIFIYNGGESDEWVESVLSNLQNTEVTVMKMTDYVSLLNERKPDHTEGEEPDEHIWTSIKNSAVLSEKIGEVMAEKDSENSNFYKESTESYVAKLNELDTEMTEISNNRKRDTVVFGDRFPFLYFLTDYGINYECAFPGCSSETEPSLDVVTRLVKYVSENDIPVVFYLEFSNGKTADIISEDTNAKTVQISSCHNVTKNDFESGLNYISLMENNISAFKEALE